MSGGLHSLPTLQDQVARLIEHDIHRLAGLTEAELRARVGDRGAESSSLLAVDPALVKPSELAPMLRLKDKQGFVVEDMSDVDDFVL